MGTCSVIPGREEKRFPQKNACVGGHDITVSVNRKKLETSHQHGHGIASGLCVNTLRCRWILSRHSRRSKRFRSSNRTKVGVRAKEMKVQFISLFCSHPNILHELARKRLVRRLNFQKSSFFSLNLLRSSVDK